MPYIIRKFEKENLIRIFMPFVVGLSLLYRLTPTWVRSQPIIGKTSYPVYALMAVTAIIITIRKFRYDDFYLWLVLFLGFRVFTTLINGQEIGWVVLSSVMCYSLVVILCYSFVVNRSGTLKVLSLLTFSLLLINLLDILQKHGIVPGHFFVGEFIENHNSYIHFFLIAITASYLWMEESRDPCSAIIWLLLFGIVCVTYYYEKSTTSIIGLALLYSYLLLFNSNWTRKFLNIYVYLLGVSAFFLLFVCGGNRGKLTEAFLKLMGKSSDLTRRVMIWRDYLSMWKKSPVIGYGVLRDTALSNTMYGLFSRFDASAHNIVLNLGFQTGIAGLVTLIIAGAKAMEMRYTIKNERVRYFFEALIGMTLLMSMFEAYSIEIYIFLISVIYIYPKCDRRNDNE